MSAFQVSGTHVAAIVGTAAAFDPFLRESLPELAAVLVAENARAVRHRYGQRVQLDVIEVAESEIDHFRACPVSPVQLLKLLDCLSYQLAEPDDWETTTAMQAIRRLRASATAALAGYSVAEWCVGDGWRP